MNYTKKIIVLGAGVSGLTTAHVLQNLGYLVKIWAKDFPPYTTSNVAPAIWYPEKLEPEDKTKEWAVQSYKKFAALSKNSETGVHLQKGYKFFHRPMGNPWWENNVLHFRRLPVSECRGAVCGYEFTGVVIDMSVYLTKYLVDEFKKRGGEWQKKDMLDVSEALNEADWVVNCTGFASRELVKDSSLFAKRGQLVRIAKISQKEFLLDTDHPEGMVYIVPRTHDCILGTVSEEGSEDLSVDPLTSQKIVERCALYYPEIQSSEILNHIVGLRPSRKSVRVESELLADGKKMTHNYGHGGNGVTLSWGCAFEVAGVKQSEE